MVKRKPEIRQPSRVIVGHCPECKRVLMVENEYDAWPLAVCECGWLGDTHEVANRARYEREGVIDP